MPELKQESREFVFITSPDSFEEISRTNTSFGLRELEHVHDEEVVPGIGSLHFVRQVSWALASIRLFSQNENVRKIGKNPAIIANALEALACKLKFKEDSANGIQYQGRGINAFRRPGSANLWEFKDLKKKQNYVQNTYRQQVVSALWGLGLCMGSTLFNQMQLSKTGELLADEFLLNQGKNVAIVLKNWICGSSGKNIESSLLSQDHCSVGEKHIMKNCLKSAIFNDPNGDIQKRIRLIKALEKLYKNKKIYQEEILISLKADGPLGALHAHQIENAIRFEKIKKDVRVLYNSCANFMVESNSNSTQLSTMCKNDKISNAYAILHQSILNYHNKAECNLPNIYNEFIQTEYKDIQNAIKYLVRHEGRALILNGSSITKGSLLKKDGFLPVTNELRNWDLVRLQLLANLWRECNG